MFRREYGSGEIAWEVAMTKSQQTRMSMAKEADLSQRRSETMAAALRALVRDLYQSQFGIANGETKLDLSMTFSVDPTEGWSVEFKQPISEQLQPQLEAYEASSLAFQAGQVYCYQCASAHCGHSRAPTVMDVFSGYQQLGTPQWTELAQFLLGIRDERVDLLFEEKPRIIARVLDGEMLRSRQLAYFGKSSKTFAILGQVVAGYFPISLGSPEAKKVALCIQVVEIRDGKGQPQLKLNLLIPGPQPQSLAEQLDSRFPWIRQACQQAKRQLLKATKGWVHQSETTRDHRVCTILERLASDLERGERKSQRQTRHARYREEMARPIHKAMADLRQARPEKMFRDLKTKAIMVCGSKGRCHAFNEAGHHITSFVIHGEAIDARLRKKRWAPLLPEQSNRFLSAFQRSDH